jgi:hypothetical protein
MGGIRDTLSDLWPEHDAELLLSAYHEVDRRYSGRRCPTVRSCRVARTSRAPRGLELASDRQALGDSLELAPFDGAGRSPSPLAGLADRHLVQRRPGVPRRRSGGPGPVDLEIGRRGRLVQPAHAAGSVSSSRPPSATGTYVAAHFHDIAPADERGSSRLDRCASSDLPRPAAPTSRSCLPETLTW